MEKFFKLPLRKNGTKGFSLAEISVVLVILGVVTAIVARFAFTTPQKQFDAKFNKISADISSNIAKGISSKTGFRFSNYRTDNSTFVNDVTSNLKGSATSIADDWSNNVSPEGADISNYTAYKMDNEAVLAIDNNGTDIYIDVNGKKGPNTLGRDIYKYQSTYENQQDMLANVNLALDDRVCVDPGEPVIPHATAFSYDAATCQYRLSSCEVGWTKSGDSCVCNLDSIKYTGRLAQKLDTASCTYGNLYCHSFDDSGKNSTYAANSNIKETKVSGNTGNNCVNTYSYSCGATTDSGKNTTYAADSNIIETKVAAAPENGCVNTYSYKCKAAKSSYQYDLATVSLTPLTPLPENDCNGFDYSCSAANTTPVVSGNVVTCSGNCKDDANHKIITASDPTFANLLNNLKSCMDNNGRTSGKYRCAAHAAEGANLRGGALLSVTNYDRLYYFELKTGEKDFFNKNINENGVYTAYTQTNNNLSGKAYATGLQNTNNFVNSAYHVTNIVTDNSGNIIMVCMEKITVGGSSCYSPLSFDLDGNGIATKENMVEYDLKGDGNKLMIFDSADAVLCFDREKDGICGKDGSELFGDNTRFGFEDKDFKGYADGFDALKALARHEGLINDDDPVLDEEDIKYLEEKWGLRVKKDGYLSDGQKLTENGITSISTGDGEKKWYENFDDKGNNLMTQEGSTFVIDNKTNIFADIWHTITDALSGLWDSITGAFQ